MRRQMTVRFSGRQETTICMERRGEICSLVAKVWIISSVGMATTLLSAVPEMTICLVKPVRIPICLVAVMARTW